MLPLSDFSVKERRGIRGVLFDIDDTLTTGGRLTAEAYAALERLQRAGLILIPITGRPAGWCDHIARMWPVSAVVGENGAFYFRYDREQRAMRRRYVDEPAVRAANRQRLAAIADEIVQSVPGAALAADQFYREADLCLPAAAVERIAGLMRARGLTAKVSSIHVNGWFGTHDKLTTTRLLMREAYGTDLAAERAAYVFVGDSPNDAPMFAWFPHAVGVANIRDFAGWLDHEPAYVTGAPAGAGFCEVADLLLSAR